MIVRWQVLAVLMCFAYSKALYAESPETSEIRAEVVWVESAAKVHTIYYRNFAHQQWQDEKTALYSSERPITTPVIVSQTPHQKHIFWTEQIAGEAVLKAMSGRLDTTSNKNIRWAKPRLFSDVGRFSIAPTAISDWENQVWLFWAADITQYSDIYYSKLVNDTWTTPRIAHASNSVPDITPIVSLTRRGAIKLQWQNYNHELAQYQLVNQEFLVESHPEKEALTNLWKNEEALVSSVEPPSFLPTSQRLFIHFPSNKLIQSIEARALARGQDSN